MHLFEVYHKMIKKLLVMGDNNRGGYEHLLENHLVWAGLNFVFPKMLGKAQDLPPCFSPLAPLTSFKWGDITGPPPFSAADLLAAWGSSPGNGVAMPAPAGLANARFFFKAHLTRSWGAEKLCNCALIPGTSVVLPCELVTTAAGAVAAEPFSPRGLTADQGLWVTHGELLLCKAFFSLPGGAEIYVLCQKFSPFESTSAAAAQSPFTLRIRRTLADPPQLFVYPLSLIFPPIPYWTWPGALHAAQDILWRPFKLIKL